MIERELSVLAFSADWGRQMRFITGPRQAGKTTVSRKKLEMEGCAALYYLWDLRSVRDRYRDNELFFTGDVALDRRNAWICFDEIHKMPRWKNILKATFDASGERFHFIVTGSAKLNLVKRAGDSLAGRYFTFHLLPLTVREVLGNLSGAPAEPEASAEAFVERQLSRDDPGNDAVEALLRFGGFPEPFLRHATAFYRKWSADYVETVVREDIGTLTRIVDREQVYRLYRLLPEATGGPLSENSLAGHIQVSPVTVKNYLRRLEDFYLGFSVPPYSRNIKRALLKARKFYLFDWAVIPDEGNRFETFVACQLRARLSLWADASGERFNLFYVRDKDKRETDFLIVRDDRPWLLIEAKLSDQPVAAHHRTTARALGGVPVVQMVREPGVAAMEAPGIYRASASRFLG